MITFAAIRHAYFVIFVLWLTSGLVRIVCLGYNE